MLVILLLCPKELADRDPVILREIRLNYNGLIFKQFSNRIDSLWIGALLQHCNPIDLHLQIS